MMEGVKKIFGLRDPKEPKKIVGADGGQWTPDNQSSPKDTESTEVLSRRNVLLGMGAVVAAAGINKMTDSQPRIAEVQRDPQAQIEVSELRRKAEIGGGAVDIEHEMTVARHWTLGDDGHFVKGETLKRGYYNQ